MHACCLELTVHRITSDRIERTLSSVAISSSGLPWYSLQSEAEQGAGERLPAAMTNRLVIAGPYRFVRNPMALAGIVQGAAVGLMMSSWLVVAYALAGSLLWNYAVRPLEEADLETRFGVSISCASFHSGRTGSLRVRI